MLIGEKARDLWQAMDENDKLGVRAGLFPMKVLLKAEAEGYNRRKLCVRLMLCAKEDDGMVTF